VGKSHRYIPYIRPYIYFKSGNTSTRPIGRHTQNRQTDKKTNKQRKPIDTPILSTADM